MADTVSEAQKLFTEAMDASREQRRQIEEDLAFTDPSFPDQWDERIKAQRESDPGGARPCLVFDQLSQYIHNVTGQIEQNPPGLHAIPVDGGADKKVAEQLDGFFRHIEHTSRAQHHYARALTSAARAGVGYLIVRPTYINRALRWQEPRISSEGDPLRVVFDPWSVELDGSDANFGFLLTPFSHRQFEREFGKDAEKVSFGDEERNTTDDERESILVAEQWRIVTERSKFYVFTDEQGGEFELSEVEWEEAKKAGRMLTPQREYSDKRSVVKWSRMSGAEELTKETEYPASGIGIVPVYGYIGWANGRMKYCGMGRKARDPQRSYNYHMSEIHAYMGTAPRSPWVVPIRAIRGVEAIWDRASVDQRAYLPYNDVDETGAIAAPQRNNPSINLANHAQMAEQAKADIQAALGMYQANLGAPSNETSGIAIEQRKQQGEASTSMFPAHLAASIAQAGRLCMEMVPRLIDTRRQLRLLGVDGASGAVVMDPEQEQAMQETDDGLVINPNVGRYDVRVVVGASFATQRTQAQMAFTEMMRANKEMTPAIAPLWAQTLDTPNADKLSQVLTAIAPPEVRAILEPEDGKDGPTKQQLLLQVQQLTQQLQEAVSIAQEAEQDGEAAEAAAEAKEDEVAIKAYDAITKRLQVLGATITPEQVQQIVMETIQAASAQTQPTGEPDAGTAPVAEGGAITAPMPELEPAPMEMAPEMPMEPQGPAPEIQALLEGQQQIAAGQEQLAALMGQLVQLVQADRERVPERGPDGLIARVVDRIVMPQPQEMQ